MQQILRILDTRATLLDTTATSAYLQLHPPRHCDINVQQKYSELCKKNFTEMTEYKNRQSLSLHSNNQRTVVLRTTC